MNMPNVKLSKEAIEAAESFQKRAQKIKKQQEQLGINLPLEANRSAKQVKEARLGPQEQPKLPSAAREAGEQAKEKRLHWREKTERPLPPLCNK